MLEIGKKIKQRREELGMTQEELAEKTGYKDRSSINKIEKGGNNLPQTKIVAFAQALNTTPSYLMGWEEPKYGNGIKLIREAKGLTQEQLANNSGLSLKQLQQYEENKSTPNMENLMRITDALDMTLFSFLCSISPNRLFSVTYFTPEGEAEILKNDIIKKLNILNQVDLKRVNEYIDDLTEYIIYGEKGKDSSPADKWEALRKSLETLSDKDLKEVWSYVKFLHWKKSQENQG